MDVEDQMAVRLWFADFGQSRVRGCGAVIFEAAKSIFETACVGEGQGFRDLDDQAVRGVFKGVRVGFSVFELLGSWDAAEDLNSWAGGVAKETQEGKADSDCDSDAEVQEEGCEKDEDHEEEL